MKKLLFLPLLAMLALCASCSDDNGSTLPENKNEVFFGKLMFNGSPVADDVKCELVIIGDVATVSLYEVAFAPAMPAMDIVIPLLKCNHNSGTYTMSGTNVVPTVAGVPVEAYRMSSVEAWYSGDKFEVTAVTSMGTIMFSNILLPITPVGGSGKSYEGDLAVGEFTSKIVVEIVKDEDASVLDIVINDVKFAAGMPMTLDVTLKGIPYLMKDGAVMFEASDVVPYINAEPDPMPAYTFASVSGSIAGNFLTLNARMADGLAAYVAGKEFAFEGGETVKN